MSQFPKQNIKRGTEKKATFSNTIVRQWISINIRQIRREERDNRGTNKMFQDWWSRRKNTSESFLKRWQRTSIDSSIRIYQMEKLRKDYWQKPVLSNLDKVKQVDNLIVSILGRTNQCIANDTNLEKFKNNLLNVMDPVSIV